MFLSKLFLSFDQLLHDDFLYFCVICWYTCAYSLLNTQVCDIYTKKRIPLRHDFFFQHLLHTCTFYHSKSDNCGSAAVNLVHISEQQWLLRRTLRYNVFVTIVSILWGILTIVTNTLDRNVRRRSHCCSENMYRNCQLHYRSCHFYYGKTYKCVKSFKRRLLTQKNCFFCVTVTHLGTT